MVVESGSSWLTVNYTLLTHVESVQPPSSIGAKPLAVASKSSKPKCNRTGNLSFWKQKNTANVTESVSATVVYSSTAVVFGLISY